MIMLKYLLIIIIMVKIASVNINGFREKDKRDCFFRWLNFFSPDILCMQETHHISNDEFLG